MYVRIRLAEIVCVTVLHHFPTAVMTMFLTMTCQLSKLVLWLSNEKQVESSVLLVQSYLSNKDEWEINSTLNARNFTVLIIIN